MTARQVPANVPMIESHNRGAAPVEVALLDLDGVIVRTNAAWDDFWLSNGGDPKRLGVGASFLYACASARHDPAALAVAEAIRTAILGDLPEPMTILVPRDAPGLPRAFQTLVSSRFDDGGAGVGATVTLSRSDITTAPSPWTPNPLAAMLRVTELRAGESSIAQTLQRLAQSARELLGVTYAAVSLSEPDGALGCVAYAGVDPQILRGLEGTRAVLDWLADSPRFLHRAVALRTRQLVTVYAAEQEGDRFTPNMERLACQFAEAATTAIENARLHQAALERNRWAEAAADLTSELVSSSSAVPLEVLLRHAARAADADVAAVLVSENEVSIRLQAVVGAMEGVVPGILFPRDGSPASEVMRTGEALLLTAPTARARELSDKALGPMAVVPLKVGPTVVGALVVTRLIDRPPFNESDVEAMSRFIHYAGVALDLDRTRADHEHGRLHDDRSRIAIEMNDHVVRQLFGVGMGLEGLIEALDDDELRGRVGGYVNALDDSIRSIRESIYRMQED